MQSMYISELGTRLFGRSWHDSGWTLHTFLHPVYAGDTLTAKAVVVDHPGAPERDRVELEVWLENQDGAKVVVGWMSAVATDFHCTPLSVSPAEGATRLGLPAAGIRACSEGGVQPLIVGWEAAVSR